MNVVRWCALILFAGLLFPIVSGSGVSPPQYTADFAPGAKLAFSFTFFNAPDTQIELSVKGDLAPYVSLSETSLSGTRTVIAYLSLPDAVEKPGPHRLAVVAREKSSAQGIGISGEAQGTIIIYVPYPGTYIESSLEATDVNQGEPVSIRVTHINRGDETTSVLTSLTIFQENTTIETRTLDSLAIAPTESRQVFTEIDTAAYDSGRYRAVASISYADKENYAEAPFRVGTLFVDIVNYSNEFERDKINRFEIDIESAWNSRIPNVFANITLPSINLSLLTPSVHLGPFERSRLTGFFDTTGISDDRFQAHIRIYYEGAVTEKTVELHFKRAFNYLLATLIAVIVIILLVFVFVIVRMRRALNASRRGARK